MHPGKVRAGSDEILAEINIRIMQVKYIPKLDNNYSPIAGREVAFSVLTPDVPKGKFYVVIAVHGIGERSGGTQEHLENLVLGQKQPDGTRKWPFVTDDMKKAVDQYNLLMIIPTYETNAFFEPSKVNYVFDYVKANYQVHDKFMLTGFSYGGGAVVKYITSSLANASRVAYAIPCAAVNSLADPTIPGKANVPVHAFSNDNDPTVNVSNTKTIITAINASNPTPRALQTIFRTNGHGGNNEAWSLTPPKAPGGQGFTDAAENIYQVFQDIIANGPRQMKGGAVIQPPATPDPVPQPPLDTLKAEFNLTDGQVITTDKFILDASASIGMKDDWQAYGWDIKPIENGSWAAMPSGGMYGGPKKELVNLSNGKYSIGLTVMNKAGQAAKKTVTIEVKISAGPVPKTAIGFDSTTDLITYSDGATERGTANFSGGKWVVKNLAGQIINF